MNHLKDPLDSPQGDLPIILNSRTMDEKFWKNPLFFITLVINDLYLHNCILDSSAATNIMPLTIMKQLGLEITRPYRNVCNLDSKPIIFHGVIENLEVSLKEYQHISFPMDIVVVDIPDSLGMLLSREWVANLRGSLQMDLSYATILTPQWKLVNPASRAYLEEPC
jgi:hypothetical protein